MVLVLGAFLYNLLCAISFCDRKHDSPEISSVRIPRQIKSHPLVRTQNGILEGYTMTSMAGREFYAFEGIRYGQHPIGENQFKLPIPASPWNGIYKAKSPGPDCLQYCLVKMFRVVGNTDCLFLNVYTPHLPDGASHPKLPVIVYIHGGSFHQGSGKEQGPTYLMDKDIILVTINYRLGILGFLSTGDEANPGNWGLKDQVLALKWTYENINEFGGDPGKITVMGHSAGAGTIIMFSVGYGKRATKRLKGQSTIHMMKDSNDERLVQLNSLYDEVSFCASVHLHLISNQSRHYIKSAFSMSGTAFNFWSINTPQRITRYKNKLSKFVGCSLENSHIFMDCIRAIGPEWLVATHSRFYDAFYAPACLFSPVVEPDLPNAFLTETPTEAYMRNHVANIPWLNTITSHEGHAALLVAQGFLQLGKMRKQFKETSPLTFEYKYDMDNVTEITDSIAKFYTGAPTVNNIAIDHLSQIFTDRYFSYGTHHSLLAHSRLAPTYAYYFSYKGVRNLVSAIGIPPEEWAPNHGEDIYYFFNSTYYVDAFRQSDPDYRISKLMINLLYNFASNGVPYYTVENGTDIQIWDSVKPDPNNLQYLQIDREVKMIKEPFRKRVEFWENLGLPDTTKWEWEKPLAYPEIDFGDGKCPKNRLFCHFRAK